MKMCKCSNTRPDPSLRFGDFGDGEGGEGNGGVNGAREALVYEGDDKKTLTGDRGGDGEGAGGVAANYRSRCVGVEFFELNESFVPKIVKSVEEEPF